MSDWTTMSAAQLGRGIAAGDIDPVALAESFFTKIEAHPMTPRIYARLTRDRAMAEAQAARDRAVAGRRLSPLDGVPVSWKDLFDTAGTATEAGSALLAGRIPDADAEVLRVATGMGLVCLGKTHMSELAFSGLGLNPVTATPPCVNDEEAVAGGSSSGAAASVAYGLAAAAVGSDTGGSVRIPSVWNDLVGLKTTHGRLSLSGVVPLCETFDTVGPLCRTVEDAVLMLSALEGRKAPDLADVQGLKGRRFAALQGLVLRDLRAEPQAAYDDALERLRSAGAEIVPVVFDEIEAAMADAAMLYTTEAWGIWGERITANPGKMFQPIEERFAGGKDFLGGDYVAAWRRLRTMRGLWADRMAGFDAVLCPTAPILPPKVDLLLQGGAYYVTENLLALRNTRVGNLMGLCAVTLPTATPSCGISLMALPMQEDRLLQACIPVEAALV